MILKFWYYNCLVVMKDFPCSRLMISYYVTCHVTAVSCASSSSKRKIKEKEKEDQYKIRKIKIKIVSIQVSHNNFLFLFFIFHFISFIFGGLRVRSNVTSLSHCHITVTWQHHTITYHIKEHRRFWKNKVIPYV